MLVVVSVCGSSGQLGLAVSRGYGSGSQLGGAVSRGYGSGSQLGGESWGGFVDFLVLVSMGFGVLDLRCFGVCWVLFSWVLAFGC